MEKMEVRSGEEMQVFDPDQADAGISDGPTADASYPLQRKRSRDVLDTDSDDCYPISKRINRLRIEYSGKTWGADDQTAAAGVSHVPASDLEALPLYCHSDVPNCSNLSGHNPGSVLPMNGHPSHLFHEDMGMYSIVASSSPCPEDVPQEFVNPGLQSMTEAINTVPAGLELLHNDDGVKPESSHGGDGVYGAMECSMVYQPELTPVQNPYYYHINGVLYNAHMARILRYKNN